MSEREARFLAGRVALVTGSVGGGIGRSTAMRLARAGADVVLNHGTSGSGRDRSDDVARVEAEIQASGSQVITVSADTRTDQGIETLVEAAKTKFGTVDILVNNAGAPWLEQDFAVTDRARWEATLAAEIVGPAQLIAAFLPEMRARGWGRIVNVAIDFRTLEALLDNVYGNRLSGFPHPFAVGKQARIELSENLAHAEIRHGITINSVLPGIIEECDWDAALSALDREPDDPPLLAGPDDIAQVIVSLCAPPFRLVTGSRIVVPGNLYERIRR